MSYVSGSEGPSVSGYDVQGPAPLPSDWTASMNQWDQTVAAAGSNQGDGGTIDANGGSTVFITGADNTKGVVLPVVANSIIGQTFTIHNTVTNKTLKVWPGSGDKILPAADNTHIVIAASCAVVVTHFSADGWVGYEPAVIVSD